MAAAESSVGARRALDDLYRSHSAEVYRYAYALLGNRSDAEDVTQTTFMNALRALERGERPRKPSNWLITITHNIVRQRFRQQQARPAEVELSGELAHEQHEDTGPTMPELVKALQRIPPSQREALVLRELEGRSYDEIAQTLSLSTSALETLLFRARRSLADELENVATCERAELNLSRQLDGRLSRKEKRRLADHIAECQSCNRIEATHRKRRQAFKGLAVLPLPLSLTFLKGAPNASAGSGLPTIGLAAPGAAPGGGPATGAGTIGGLALGGVAVKIAAVVAAVSVVGGIGYVGTERIRHHDQPAKPTPAATHRTQTRLAGSVLVKRRAAKRAAARVLSPAPKNIGKRAVGIGSPATRSAGTAGTMAHAS